MYWHSNPQPKGPIRLRCTQPPRPTYSHHVLQIIIIAHGRYKIDIRIRRTLPPGTLKLLNLVSAVTLIIHLSLDLYLPLLFSELQCLLFGTSSCFSHTDGWVLAELDYASVLEGDDAAGCSVDCYAGTGRGAGQGHVVAG